MILPSFVTDEIIGSTPNLGDEINEVDKIEKPVIIRNINTQRRKHHIAKNWMLENSRCLSISFYSPPKISNNIDLTKWNSHYNMKGNSLDNSIFSYNITYDVGKNIIQDSHYPKQTTIYGIMSQYNGCDSGDKFVPQTSSMCYDIYLCSQNHGADAQLVFPIPQIELLRRSAELGLNSLCNILDNSTCSDVSFGILTPTKHNVEKFIEQIKRDNHRIEYPAITNNVYDGGETPITLLFGSAPAYGSYENGIISPIAKKEISFLLALCTYRAQFTYIININKPNIVFKPCILGIGSFSNDIQMITKAYYIACKGFERELKLKNIIVELQIYSNHVDISQYLIDNLFDV